MWKMIETSSVLVSFRWIIAELKQYPTHARPFAKNGTFPFDTQSTEFPGLCKRKKERNGIKQTTFATHVPRPGLSVEYNRLRMTSTVYDTTLTRDNYDTVKLANDIYEWSYKNDGEIQAWRAWQRNFDLSRGNSRNCDRTGKFFTLHLAVSFFNFSSISRKNCQTAAKSSPVSIQVVPSTEPRGKKMRRNLTFSSPKYGREKSDHLKQTEAKWRPIFSKRYTGFAIGGRLFQAIRCFTVARLFGQGRVCSRLTRTAPLLATTYYAGRGQIKPDTVSRSSVLAFQFRSDPLFPVISYVIGCTRTLW